MRYIDKLVSLIIFFILTIHRDIFITGCEKVNRLIKESKKDFFIITIKESSNIHRDLYKCV